jgi:hypothetical protein
MSTQYRPRFFVAMRLLIEQESSESQSIGRINAVSKQGKQTPARSENFALFLLDVI